MDPVRFDRLAKALSTSGTRRGALGGFLAGTLSLLGLTETADARRKSQHKQHQDQDQPRQKDARTRTEACIPTGKPCPSPKPRGRTGKGKGKRAPQLSCEQCCQGHVTTDADGKRVCACQTVGLSCGGAGECCSGICTGGTCRATADALPRSCAPTTCAAQGKNCGSIPDGCGRTLNCGSCSAPNTCGGGNPGTANVCGCTNSTCPAGATCGTVPNVCGGTVSCGPVACSDCDADIDCGSGFCQGRSCVPTLAGTCAAGADSCTEGSVFIPCGNDRCDCRQTVAGDTLCAGDGYCADCTASAGCQPGEVCIQIPATGPCCGDTKSACVEPCPPEGVSCFVAGTRVAMADGTSRPIERVAVGDRVLGREGVNRVVAIERPRLGSRRLYAFNGGPFFVTAEHPFLTEEGWKAVDPAATAAENPALVVGRLDVGDRLLALAGVAVLAAAGGGGAAVAPHLAAVPLGSLIGMAGDPATPLYNLRLDGDHAYFADDLLVHNK